MFLIRSAFWLTVAFVLLAPHDVDLGARAGQAGAELATAGTDLIASHILDADCSTVECLGGKAMLAVVTRQIPSVDTPMHAPSAAPVPLPRPRPASMG